MNVQFIPCWDEDRGGEVYNVILKKEKGNCNKNKVSIDFEYDEFTNYVVSVENGVLWIKKGCLNDRGPNYYTYLVNNGFTKKDDLIETIITLKIFEEKHREFIEKQEEDKRKEEYRKNEWLNSPIHKVEIKVWL